MRCGLVTQWPYITADLTPARGAGLRNPCLLGLRLRRRLLLVETTKFVLDCDQNSTLYYVLTLTIVLCAILLQACLHVLNKPSHYVSSLKRYCRARCRSPMCSGPSGFTNTSPEPTWEMGRSPRSKGPAYVRSLRREVSLRERREKVPVSPKEVNSSSCLIHHLISKLKLKQLTMLDAEKDQESLVLACGPCSWPVFRTSWAHSSSV